MQSADSLTLAWYGDASLVLRCPEAAIAFDPFAGLPIGSLRCPPEKLPFADALGGADAVFVTHGHFDHIYHIPRLYGGGEAPVFCTPAPAKTLAAHGLPADRIRQIAPGWAGCIGPFQIRAWQGRHCRFDSGLIAETIFRPGFFRHFGHLLQLTKLDLTYPEAGEILFYELFWGGKRIQIMGSMNLDPNVDYPTGAQLLVLPFQGRSDQDTYALGIVERLKPGAVVLDHYDDAFPPFSDQVNTAQFVKNVQTRFGIPCRPLEKGVTVTLEQLIQGL